MEKDFVDLVGGGGTHLYKNISISYMFNRGNYSFNPNFQKGTSTTKKTNFGIIQEPDQLLFRRDFFFPFLLYFLFFNFYRQISIQKRRSPLVKMRRFLKTCVGAPFLKMHPGVIIQTFMT